MKTIESGKQLNTHSQFNWCSSEPSLYKDNTKTNRCRKRRAAQSMIFLQFASMQCVKMLMMPSLCFAVYDSIWFCNGNANDKATFAAVIIAIVHTIRFAISLNEVRAYKNERTKKITNKIQIDANKIACRIANGIEVDYHFSIALAFKRQRKRERHSSWPLYAIYFSLLC